MLGWFRALSILKKLILVGGSIAAIGTATQASSPSTPESLPTKTVQNTTQIDDKKSVKSDNVEIKTETKTESINYEKITKYDATLARGKTLLSQKGVVGEKIITYKVTYTNEAETAREKVSEEITTKPINQITLIGTKIAIKPKISSPKCDPNYSGACVPIASDVDCAGGSGNGPAYVSGPVKVIGTDIYHLDADHDGYGCE